MEYAWPSGVAVELRRPARAAALACVREQHVLHEERAALAADLAGLADDAPEDLRIRLVQSLARLTDADAALLIGAVLVAVRPRGAESWIPWTAPRGTLIERCRALHTALVDHGLTVEQLAGLRLTASAMLTASLGVVEPEEPAPVRRLLYPGIDARRLAGEWLGCTAEEVSQRVPIGDDELAARVALRACGSPVAWRRGWPEWIRLGQDGIDHHAALILCDLLRGVRP